MTGRNKKRNGNKINKGNWKVGIYCRLSSEDGDNAESDSILNQKEIILLYLNKKSNMNIIDYYIDDGYSGTTFLRPNFKRMFKDIVNGKINTIIVKDLSRFGRNYLEVGKYLEQIFPLYETRFIAINDSIDSYEEPKSINNVIVPFKNLINDEYARDISNKVRSVYKTKATNGEYVAGTTPYGYKKNPDNKYQLIIDEDEAVNVRLIFRKYLDGDGQIKICFYLNDNKILCRKEIQRRRKAGISLDSNEDKIRYQWSKSTIGKMLTNETYIGNVVQGKTTTVSYKNHKIIHKPKEDWIIVKNKHMPIISKNDFFKVQNIMKERNEEKKHVENLTIYYGKIKCADCGRGMCKMEDTREKRNVSNYYCRNYKTTSSQCSPHKIKTSTLNNLVLEAILFQVKLVIDFEKTLDKINDKGELKEYERFYNYNANKLNNDIEKIKKTKRSSYEDWKLDKISKEQFAECCKNYDEEINKLNEEIITLKKTYNENIKDLKKENYWIDHFKKNKNVKILTKEVIEELIDTIYVHEGGNITIKFKYQDEYLKAVEMLRLKEGGLNE